MYEMFLFMKSVS